MLAYLVLVLAALSRLLPHSLHAVGINITAVGGGLLFFGARQPRGQALVGMAVMAATDIYLTCCVYHYPFHVTSYLLTWAWYLAICLLGSGLLRRATAPRVAAAVFSSATGFFLVSDFVVWVGSGMYPHTRAGLLACYAVALPFYGNDLASTTLTAGVLFGLPAVAAVLVKTMQGSAQQGQPS